MNIVEETFDRFSAPFKIERKPVSKSLYAAIESRVAEEFALKGGPGSGNFGHEGRPGEVGGSSSGGTIPDGQEFESKLSTAMARLAQKVYDDWDENVDEYGGGGICHLIADEMAGELNSQGIEAVTTSAEIGEQHVWVTAKLSDGIYIIDIPPSIYETGGGYNWQKILGVQFSERDIIVDRLDADPEKFSEYTDY